MKTLGKKCAKCNTVKEMTEFHYKNKAREIRGSYCKDCDKELRDKKWNIQTHVPKMRSALPDTRICPNCKTEKALNHLNFNRKGDEGFQYYCRACQANPAKGKLAAEIEENPREIILRLTEKVERLQTENNRLKVENEVLKKRNTSMGLTLEELNRVKQCI